MALKTWTVETQGNRHEVTLDWGYWGGRRTVSVDGKEVDSSTFPLRWKSTQEFDLDGTPCVVRTKPSTKFSARFLVELEVDGRLIDSSSPRDGWESKKKAA
ncbi:hypothetical protein DSM112329_02020 [Paraconexibacter sp. AEG42_29]|uniref:Uncharacterized protein n=1 Tax=Paraconexibacter sp. AEG42_29 TaxID=2997339 RepID=A0AAU7AU09_9ACTN